MSTSLLRRLVIALVLVASLLVARRQVGEPSPRSASTVPIEHGTETGTRAGITARDRASPRASLPRVSPARSADARQREQAIAAANAFVGWLTAWRRDEQPSIVDGVRLAQARRAALKELIAIDPQAALAHAVPRGLRSDLPPAIAAELETPVDAYAELEVVAVCFGAENAIVRHVTTGGRRYEAHVHGRRLDSMSKARVPIHGIAIDDQLAVDERPYRRLEPNEFAPGDEWAMAQVVAVGGEIRTFASAAALHEWSDQVLGAEAMPGPGTDVTATAPATAAAVTESWVFGQKSVIWIRAEFPDDPGSPATDEQITAAMATVNTYYGDVSRNRTSFKTTIFPGTLRTRDPKAEIAESPTTGQRLISDDVLQQARDYDAAHGGTGEFNPDRYDRWIVIFKRVPELAGSIRGTPISWAGLAAVGNTSLWLNGWVPAGTIAHELGHNHGLFHSHSWKPSGSSPLQPGTTDEYGDVFDIMGKSASMPAGHFNTKQKSNIHFLAAAEIKAVASSGTYRLYRTDHREAGGVQALRIAAASAYDYWLEYRQLTLPNVPAAGVSRLKNGILLHWGSRPNFALGSGTFLLDSTPPSSLAMNDAALALGETFSDADYGINITPVENGGTSPAEWIDVRIAFGATGDNHNPTVKVTPPASGALRARTDLSFSAHGTDPDGDPVIFRWNFGDDQLSPVGSSVQHRWVKGGRYMVSVSAVDGRGGFASESFPIDLADPMLVWTQRAGGTTVPLYAVLHADGKFVALGSGGTVVVSTDGVAWSARSRFPTTFLPRTLAYGNGRYVAVGRSYDAGSKAYSGAAYWSADALTWQQGTIPGTTTELNAVTASAGRLLAVGKNGKAYHSTDGAAWTEVATGVTSDLRAIRYAVNQFVAVGAAGRVLTSPDGLTWTNRSVATTYTLVGVARHRDLWYATSGYDTWTSADAVNWAQGADAAGVSVNGLFASREGLLLSPTYEGKIALAENASAWDMVVATPTDATVSFYDLAEGNGLVVAVGSRGSIYTAGSPAMIAPQISDPAAVERLAAGRPNLIAVEPGAFTRLELIVDGRKVTEAAGNAAGLWWTPPRFGSYQIVVRAVSAGAATVDSLPIMAEATLTDWTWLNPLPAGTDLNAAVRAWDRWWIVGDIGTLYSVDDYGRVTPVDLRTTVDFRGIVHGNGRLVVAGRGYDYAHAIGAPGVWSSTDGVQWEPWTGSAYQYLNSVAFSGSVFVSVGDSGRIVRSADGIAWTTPRSPVTARLNEIAWGSGRWVAVGDSGRIITSPDGTTWTAAESGTTNVLYSVTHAAGQFVTVGAAGTILTSADGLAWAAQESGVTQALRGAGFAFGRFVAAGDSGRVLVSTDGISWSPAVFDSRNAALLGVAGTDGGALLLGGGGEYYGSIDGANWQRKTQGESDSFRAVIHAAGKFVAVTTGYDSMALKWLSPIMSSDDGITWNRWSAGATAQVGLNAISYGQATFLAVGNTGRIYTSEDGTNWTRRESGVSATLYGAASGPAGHVAVGVNGTILNSADGVNWSLRSSSVATALRAAAFGNNTYVAVGDGGTIVSSPDGATWTVQISGSLAALQTVLWLEGTGFVAGGATGTVLVSPDGVSWSARNPGITSTIYAVANTPTGLVVTGAANGAVRFSVNGGVTWIKGALPADRPIRGLAANANCVVAVGESGALLVSSYRAIPPVIVSQPRSTFAAAGAQVTLSVQVRSASGAAYQWFKDGTAMLGATKASLTLSGLTAAHTGDYVVRVANAGGTVTSELAKVALGEPANPGRLVNLSLRTMMSSSAESFTIGFVVAGAGTTGTKPLLVRAAGPSLVAFGIAEPLADPKLEFFAGPERIGENDDWNGDAGVIQASAQVAAFPFSGAGSKDAAMYFPGLQSGAGHSVVVSGTGAGEVIAELYDLTATDAFTIRTPRLINVSVRKDIGAGATIGFVVGGNSRRTLLIRAIGPTLAAPPFEVPGVITDPQLELFAGATPLGRNDNWGGTSELVNCFAQLGAFPLPGDSKDAALLLDLQPGSYTVHVSGVGGVSGVALLEVYEVPP